MVEKPTLVQNLSICGFKVFRFQDCYPSQGKRKKKNFRVVTLWASVVFILISVILTSIKQKIALQLTRSGLAMMMMVCQDAMPSLGMYPVLESRPEYPREKASVRGLLLVACGRFKCGSIDHTSDLRIFSHQVQYLKSKRSGPYTVYPGKGETWALFKDWDNGWSYSPSNHMEYKYEVVEILSDYEYGVGLLVGYLDKIPGFVSLFELTRLTGVDTFFIKPKDYYRFSHQIPSFKMTGTEGEGVPAGSFELDFYALSVNTDDIWYPGKAKEDRETSDSEPLENVLPAVPPGTRDKSSRAENATTSLKSGNLKGMRATNGDPFMLVDLELKLWFDETKK